MRLAGILQLTDWSVNGLRRVEKGARFEGAQNQGTSQMAVGATHRRKRERNQDLIDRRRSEILATAAIAFARHGYSNTDVQTIADDVGVAKGTLYHYFGSKEHIFLAAVDDGMRQLNERLTLVYGQATDPLEAIAAGIYVYLQFFDSNKSIVELFIQERAHFADRKKPTYFVYRDANIGPWRDLAAVLIKQRRLHGNSVDQIVDAMGALLYGSMFTNYFSKRKQSVESQAADLIGVAFHGILSNRDSMEWTSVKIDEIVANTRRFVRKRLRRSESPRIAEQAN
jgi:AcrR family transcriptional regulator